MSRRRGARANYSRTTDRASHSGVRLKSLRLELERPLARAPLALKGPAPERVHLGDGDPVAQRRELGLGVRGGDPVDEQRGEPVERVIIDLKQEMRAAGVVNLYVRPEERALAEAVIRWCIERYYGTA